MLWHLGESIRAVATCHDPFFVARRPVHWRDIWLVRLNFLSFYLLISYCSSEQVLTVKGGAGVPVSFKLAMKRPIAEADQCASDQGY